MPPDCQPGKNSSEKVKDVRQMTTWSQSFTNDWRGFAECNADKKLAILMESGLSTSFELLAEQLRLSSSQPESCPPETISIDGEANGVNHFVARHLDETFSRKAEPNLNEKEFLELLQKLFVNKISNFGDFSVQRVLRCREALRREKRAKAWPISLEPLLSGLGFTSSIPTSKLMNDFIKSCIKSMSSATGDNFGYLEHEISFETQKLQVVFEFIINQVLSRESEFLSFNEANDKEVWLRIYLQNANSLNNNFIKALKCCWFKRESIRHFYLRMFDFRRFLEETGLQKRLIWLKPVWTKKQHFYGCSN